MSGPKNRHERRAEAAKARATERRHRVVRQALAYMQAADSPTLTGATLFLPSGKVLHLPAEAARAMKPERAQ